MVCVGELVVVCVLCKALEIDCVISIFLNASLLPVVAKQSFVIRLGLLELLRASGNDFTVAKGIISAN